MTYTLVARCRRTGRAGIASTTVSLAIGGSCPFYTPAGDIVVSQAFVSPADGVAMTRALLAGADAATALAAPRAIDPHVDFRQLMILPRDGRPVGVTGAGCRPWAGERIDDDLIAAGNVLAGPAVLDAMVDAFHAASGLDLDERLLRALEAGREAGGQALADGRAIAERSAMLRVIDVAGDPLLPLVDLRVDVHPSAVHELRRVHAIHAVYARYFALRDHDAPNAPSIVAFETDALRDGGVFAERPSCFR